MRRAKLAHQHLRLDHDQLLVENEHLREALRTIELTLERYADHYDLAPFGSLTLDRAGIIREINRAACVTLGLARPVALGTVLHTLVRSEDRRALLRHLAACRRRGESRTRVHLVRRDGGVVEVELLSRRAGQKGQYFSTTVVEPGERERDPEGLLAAARQALDSGAARTAFLAMVSHELRAPLAPLLAAVAAIEQRVPAEPEVMRLCQIIRRSMNTEVRLIEDLLDATRLDRGKMGLVKAPTEVHAVVQAALEPAAVAAKAKGLHLTVALAAERHLVEGDHVRLTQVFANLLSNAIKFTPPGGRIAVRSWNSGASIAVEVSDSGAGIDAAALPRLFTPFEQADQLPGSQGGLGLGLVISKGIIDLHRGRITASSAGPGQGTRFAVVLPLLPVANPVRGNGHGRARILLVEDNLDTAEALSMALWSNGYHIDCVHSLASALKFDLDAVDLLISDLQLSDGDGCGLLKLLRARRPVMAIALSGSGSENAVEITRAAGFFAHLIKPVEMEVLTATIERALAEKRRIGEATSVPARR